VQAPGVGVVQGGPSYVKAEFLRDALRPQPANLFAISWTFWWRWPCDGRSGMG